MIVDELDTKYVAHTLSLPSPGADMEFGSGPTTLANRSVGVLTERDQRRVVRLTLAVRLFPPQTILQLVETAATL